MITEQEIENTLNRLNKLSEEEFVNDYRKTIINQEELFKFVVQSSQELGIEKESENAMSELLYNIFSIYNDKYEDKYKLVEEKTIMSVLNDKNEADIEQARILGVDLNSNELNEETIKIIEKVNTAIETKTTDSLTGKSKEFFEHVNSQNNRVNQKYLNDYITYFISSDELIKDNDRPMINMIIDTVVEAIEKQMKL